MCVWFDLLKHSIKEVIRARMHSLETRNVNNRNFHSIHSSEIVLGQENPFFSLDEEQMNVFHFHVTWNVERT